jgi:hypothetical protein
VAKTGVTLPTVVAWRGGSPGLLTAIGGRYCMPPGIRLSELPKLGAFAVLTARMIRDPRMQLGRKNLRGTF